MIIKDVSSCLNCDSNSLIRDSSLYLNFTKGLLEMQSRLYLVRLLLYHIHVLCNILLVCYVNLALYVEVILRVELILIRKVI